MRRRRVLRNIAITSVSLTGGCLSRVSGINSENEEKPGGNVLVRNDDDTEHKVKVKIANDSKMVFESEFRIEPSANKNFPDAFNGGIYNVTVELNGKNTANHQLTIGDCSAITLHITITESKQVEIKQDYCD